MPSARTAARVGDGWRRSGLPPSTMSYTMPMTKCLSATAAKQQDTGSNASPFQRKGRGGMLMRRPFHTGAAGAELAVQFAKNADTSRSRSRNERGVADTRWTNSRMASGERGSGRPESHRARPVHAICHCICVILLSRHALPQQRVDVDHSVGHLISTNTSPTKPSGLAPVISIDGWDKPDLHHLGIRAGIMGRAGLRLLFRAPLHGGVGEPRLRPHAIRRSAIRLWPCSSRARRCSPFSSWR